MTTTTPVTAPPAPVGRRIAAALIDGALTSVAAGVLSLSVLPSSLAALRGTDDPGTVTVNPVLVVVGLVVLLAWGGVQWWFHGTQGWTVGRRILGLRVVDVRTARPIGLGRALGRTLVLSLSSLACGVGQLVVLASILFDGSGKHRGWHDRAADAIVVDVRGLPAAARIAATPRPAAGPVPGAPVAPGAGVVAGAASGTEEQERTRWGALAADRRLDDPHLVLPPLGTPGPGPDLDTRALPVVPGGSAYPLPGGTAPSPYSTPGGAAPSPYTAPPSPYPAAGGAAQPPFPAPGDAAPTPYPGGAAPSPYPAPASGYDPAPSQYPAPGGAGAAPSPYASVGETSAVAPGGPPAAPAPYPYPAEAPPAPSPYPYPPAPAPAPGVGADAVPYLPPPHPAPPSTPPAAENAPPPYPYPAADASAPAPVAPTAAPAPTPAPAAPAVPAWDQRCPVDPAAAPSTPVPPGAGRHAVPFGTPVAPGPEGTVAPAAPAPAVPGYPTPAAPAHPATEAPTYPAPGTAELPGASPLPGYPAPAVQPPAAAAPVPAPAFPAPPAGAPLTGATPAVGALPGWAVRLPDGTLVDLESPLLVGRNPDPVAGARVVNVSDPGRSVSKTHLMLGRDAEGPWVVDRGSTNGTLVTLPDGQRIVCLPDRRVRLAEGSVIQFGDLSLTVGVRA